MEFLNKLDEYIASEDKKEEGKHNKSRPSEYYVHSLGYCPRVIYFDKLDPLEDTKETKRLFLIGNIFHKWVQTNLNEDYKTEVSIEFETEGIKLKGRIDLMNSKEIIELKTIGNNDYLNKPKHEHIVQINTYLGITGLKEGKIIYIKKNDFDIKSFNIRYSEEMFKDTLKEIKALDKKIKKKVSYKKVIPYMSPTCYWCKYKQTCLKQ